MKFTPDDLIRSLIYAFPMLVVGLALWWHKRGRKRSAKHSEVLRRPSE